MAYESLLPPSGVEDLPGKVATAVRMRACACIEGQERGRASAGQDAAQRTPAVPADFAARLSSLIEDCYVFERVRWLKVKPLEETTSLFVITTSFVAIRIRYLSERTSSSRMCSVD